MGYKNIKVDVVIILGGGITESGVLLYETKKRLDIFLKNKEKISRNVILLSGRWSGFLKIKPKQTEAQAMKNYLVNRGVNKEEITLEKKSLDTISNSIFSKQILDKHKKWRRVLLITSDSHIKRALWIFNKVFGETYDVVAFPAATNKLSRDKRKNYEYYLLGVANKFLKNSFTGTKELVNLLKKKHPFYSKSKDARQLLKDLIKEKIKFYG